METQLKYTMTDVLISHRSRKVKVTDEESLVLGVVTTSANVNEIGNMEEVLSIVQLDSQYQLVFFINS